MENDFKEFVGKRCEIALQECDSYMESEYSGKMSQDELQIEAEKLCYIRGVKDTLSFLNKANL